MNRKNPIHEALKNEFKAHLRSLNFKVEEEVVFSKIMPTTRQYRADYCILDQKIIIEINGGSWINGRHNRASPVKGKPYTTYENDLNKINLAQSHGWKVYQFTYEMLKRREYIGIIAP